MPASPTNRLKLAKREPFRAQGAIPDRLVETSGALKNGRRKA